MRGGTNERRFQRFCERSEDANKAMKAVFQKLRLMKADEKENPWRPGRRRRKGHEGPRERPTDPLPDRTFEKRSIPKDTSDSCDLEDPFNIMRASPAGFGRRGIVSAPDTLQGRNREEI
jgi:hypothetical protein